MRKTSSLRHLLSVAALAAIPVAAQGAVTVFSDTDSFSTSDWVSVTNVNIGSAGYNLNPTLTGGTALNFKTDTYTNSISPAVTTNLFDNTYVLRQFTPQNLTVGDKLLLDFKVSAPSSPSGNQVRGTRGVNFRFIGLGTNTVPAGNLTFGTVNTSTAISGDLDYEPGNNTSINFGGAVSFGAAQTNVSSNQFTGAVGSNKLYTSGGGNVSLTPAGPNLASNWTGDRVTLELERTADNGIYATFQIVITAYQADGITTQSFTASNTLDPDFGTSQKFGSGLTIPISAIAIGVGAAGQISAGGSGYVDFTLDNVSVSYVAVPEPASIALIAIGSIALLGRFRRAV